MSFVYLEEGQEFPEGVTPNLFARLSNILTKLAEIRADGLFEEGAIDDGKFENGTSFSDQSISAESIRGSFLEKYERGKVLGKYQPIVKNFSVSPSCKTSVQLSDLTFSFPEIDSNFIFFDGQYVYAIPHRIESSTTGQEIFVYDVRSGERVDTIVLGLHTATAVSPAFSDQHYFDGENLWLLPQGIVIGDPCFLFKISLKTGSVTRYDSPPAFRAGGEKNFFSGICGDGRFLFLTRSEIVSEDDISIYGGGFSTIHIFDPINNSFIGSPSSISQNPSSGLAAPGLYIGRKFYPSCYFSGGVVWIYSAKPVFGDNAYFNSWKATAFTESGIIGLKWNEEESRFDFIKDLKKENGVIFYSSLIKTGGENILIPGESIGVSPSILKNEEGELSEEAIDYDFSCGGFFATGKIWLFKENSFFCYNSFGSSLSLEGSFAFEAPNNKKVAGRADWTNKGRPAFDGRRMWCSGLAAKSATKNVVEAFSLPSLGFGFFQPRSLDFSAVTGNKVTPEALGQSKFRSPISPLLIPDYTITSSKIKNNSVAPTQYFGTTITNSEKIAFEGWSVARVADSAITSAKLFSNSDGVSSGLFDPTIFSSLLSGEKIKTKQLNSATIESGSLSDDIFLVKKDSNNSNLYWQRRTPIFQADGSGGGGLIDKLLIVFACHAGRVESGSKLNSCKFKWEFRTNLDYEPAVGEYLGADLIFCRADGGNQQWQAPFASVLMYDENQDVEADVWSAWVEVEIDISFDRHDVFCVAIRRSENPDIIFPATMLLECKLTEMQSNFVAVSPIYMSEEFRFV